MDFFENMVTRFVSTCYHIDSGEDKTLHLNFSKKQSLIIRYLAFGKVPKINSYCL